MRKLSLLVLMLVSIYASAQNNYLFIGTYTGSGSKGIYVYRFNSATGETEWVSNTDSAANPSYVAIAPSKQFVYAVNETGRKNPGKVSAYAFDAATGKLTFINQQVTGGDDPCYVAVDKSGKWVTVGNYSGGSLAAFPVNDDGSLNPYSQLIQHTGKGANPQRQEKAHVHQTFFSPAYDYLFSPDLGMDQVTIYKFNPAAQQPLTPATPPHISVTPGNGPRHITFHPNKRFAYLIQELSGTVGAFKYANGKLTLLQQIATHPANFKGDIGSADIHISPDGKFLYASNRGEENTITIFAINPTTGKLTLKGFQPTLGKTPRNFTIDPTGNFLLVANQTTNNIVIFKRNKQTGLLENTGKGLDIPSPVCLQLLPQ